MNFIMGGFGAGRLCGLPYAFRRRSQWMAMFKMFAGAGVIIAIGLFCWLKIGRKLRAPP